MAEVSVEQVKQWFKDQEEDLYDFELGYLSKGDTIELDSLPEGYLITVVDTNTDRSYESYGNMYLENGYIIFEVKDSEGIRGTFKLPIEYSSYEGWGYYVDRISATKKYSRIVTVWEWA